MMGRHPSWRATCSLLSHHDILSCLKSGASGQPDHSHLYSPTADVGDRQRQLQAGLGVGSSACGGPAGHGHAHTPAASQLLGNETHPGVRGHPAWNTSSSFSKHLHWWSRWELPSSSFELTVVHLSSAFRQGSGSGVQHIVHCLGPWFLLVLDPPACLCSIQ